MIDEYYIIIIASVRTTHGDFHPVAMDMQVAG
jgi:hypothetical protein